MVRQRLDAAANVADCFRRCCDGICSFPRLACVRGDALDIEFEPRTSLMRNLDLVVGGLGVQHPLVRADPARIDSGFNAAHVGFLVHGTDE